MKIDRDPFSSGTEYEVWEARNCDRCVKASFFDERKNRYTKVRCAIQRDIFARMMNNDPIPIRSYRACQVDNCPYLKLERPAIRRKPSVARNELELRLDL